MKEESVMQENCYYTRISIESRTLRQDYLQQKTDRLLNFFGKKTPRLLNFWLLNNFRKKKKYLGSTFIWKIESTVLIQLSSQHLQQIKQITDKMFKNHKDS